jgi:cation diffusion facilitator CzcD-associated flavoprotein CzcO
MRIAIIGAGPGGLCMGKRLLDEGLSDFVVLEKSTGVGGTWYRNTYPGAACDIASHLYCYSFAPNPDWSRPFAPQAEIQAYFEKVATDYGLRDHLRLGVGVRSTRWDEGRARWILALDSGDEVEARFVVSALGMFGRISIPAIPGLEDFEGTRFHSAEWNHDHDLSGERIGVIGSAASAVQFVPEIAKQASRLFVFQRTPNWVLPKEDVPYTPEQREAFRRQPELMAERRQNLFNLVEYSLEYERKDFSKAIPEEMGRKALEVVRDPVVRARLTPDHPFGCKRPLLSNDYLQTFNRDDVELVVDPIERITADAIVTRDGKTRPVDTIILATGFETTRYASAIETVGRGGRRLEEVWADGPEAYLGLTTSGFPNLFMLYGPNTNGGNSIILMLEYQVEYMIRLLDAAKKEGADWIDVRRDVLREYNDRLQKELDGIPVLQASCNGYYRSPSGRIVTQWPFTMAEFQQRTARLDPTDFEVAARA